VLLKRPDLILEKRNLSSENERADPNMMLYEYGVECDYFLIILDGSAVLEMGGKDRNSVLEVNAGPFSYYGVNALVEESVRDAEELFALLQQQLQLSTDTIGSGHSARSRAPAAPKLGYKPEFSLKVSSYCVYMKLTRADWLDLVKKSRFFKSHRFRTSV
jgi:hypothetical protein